MFRDDPLVHEPGERYLYSSHGWNLVSAVLEGASEQPFLELMAERVFRPLGMDRTVADYTHVVLPGCTSYYQRNKAGVLFPAPPVDNSYKWASGGFLSTPEDLVRFGTAHLEPGFLAADTLDLLFTSQALPSGEKTGYGIGWKISGDGQGQRIRGHTGGSVGGTTAFLLCPDTGVVVALVANLTDASLSYRHATEIASLFAPAPATPR